MAISGQLNGTKPPCRLRCYVQTRLHIDIFSLDSIDGLTPRLGRGKLVLMTARRAQVRYTSHDSLSFLNGGAGAARKTMEHEHAVSNESDTVNSQGAINGHKPISG